MCFFLLRQYLIKFVDRGILKLKLERDCFCIPGNFFGYCSRWTLHICAGDKFQGTNSEGIDIGEHNKTVLKDRNTRVGREPFTVYENAIFTTKISDEILMVFNFQKTMFAGKIF